MPRSKKICKNCGESRSIEEFPVRKDSGNRRGTCDLCIKEKQERDRHRKYKLEESELKALTNYQQNACAICYKRVPLCVDHDHATGEIRGLLCGKCNVGLGMFMDSITLLKRAQLYLTKANYSQAKTKLDHRLKKDNHVYEQTRDSAGKFQRRDVT